MPDTKLFCVSTTTPSRLDSCACVISADAVADFVDVFCSDCEFDSAGVLDEFDDWFEVDCGLFSMSASTSLSFFSLSVSTSLSELSSSGDVSDSDAFSSSDSVSFSGFFSLSDCVDF